jgi:hypothetical protein
MAYYKRSLGSCIYSLSLAIGKILSGTGVFGNIKKTICPEFSDLFNLRLCGSNGLDLYKVTRK